MRIRASLSVSVPRSLSYRRTNSLSSPHTLSLSLSLSLRLSLSRLLSVSVAYVAFEPANDFAGFGDDLGDGPIGRGVDIEVVLGRCEEEEEEEEETWW